MPKPVTTVIRRQPIGPKPSWRDLFLEPKFAAEVVERDGDQEEDDTQPAAITA